MLSAARAASREPPGEVVIACPALSRSHANPRNLVSRGGRSTFYLASLSEALPLSSMPVRIDPYRYLPMSPLRFSFLPPSSFPPFSFGAVLHRAEVR